MRYPFENGSMVEQRNGKPRREWREMVRSMLDAMGCGVEQMPAGAWRVAKGSAYLVVTDLADLNHHELRMLEKA